MTMEITRQGLEATIIKIEKLEMKDVTSSSSKCSSSLQQGTSMEMGKVLKMMNLSTKC
jgi:hypothetical protein